VEESTPPDIATAMVFVLSFQFLASRSQLIYETK